AASDCVEGPRTATIASRTVRETQQTRYHGHVNEPPESNENRETERRRASISTHWFTIDQAARMLGISPIAIRKRIAGGSLTGIRAGRGWRVLLAGEMGAERSSDAVETSATLTTGDDTTGILVQTTESLTALVRDLQRQSLTLAGQIGYLQSQLVQSQEQVTSITAQRESLVQEVRAESGISAEEHETLLQEVNRLRLTLEEHEQRARNSRWWRFGRK
ncbi:MAG: helix-turn-helix domain-containing protein, partial [Chloroflexota bacterium]